MYCKSLNGKCHIIVLLMVMIFAGCSSTETRCRELAAGFKDPGKEARPRAYWNWLNGAVTHEGLTRDLEEAKDKGLGGLEMWDTEAMRNPGNFVPAGPSSYTNLLYSFSINAFIYRPLVVVRNFHTSNRFRDMPRSFPMVSQD